jgi:hypothetical protein
MRCCSLVLVQVKGTSRPHQLGLHTNERFVLVFKRVELIESRDPFRFRGQADGEARGARGVRVEFCVRKNRTLDICQW